MIGGGGIGGLWFGLRAAVRDGWCAKSCTLRLAIDDLLYAEASLVRYYLQFILSALIVLVTCSSAIGEVTIKRANIIGTVSYVDDGAVMHLIDVLAEVDYPISRDFKVRNWAISIEPRELSLIVRGRRVVCALVQETAEYVDARCEVENSFSVGYEKDPALVYVGDVIHYFDLGTMKCADDDLLNAEALGLIWLREYCGAQ